MPNTKTTSYTDKSILRAPKKDYMNEAMLAFFEQRLLDLKKETSEHIAAVKKEISEFENSADDLDKAVVEEDRMLKLRIIERESKLLPKIDLSLRLIEEGTYGYCEETGEPIGVPRLLLRPTATFSIEAKEFREAKEKDFHD